MRYLLIYVCLSAVALCQQGHPIGELQSSDAAVRGAVVLAASGTQVMSGSQITAGGTPATVKLTRGGELRLCPNASISLSSSNTGKEQLVGLSAGSIEAHYSLTANADTVVTPDFRIQLPGPGSFDFAFGMNERGEVCVESLKGNSSSVVVSEQFGDGTHQVRPGERLLFKNGKVAEPERDFPGQCGCPAAPKTIQAKQEFGFPEQQAREAAAAIASGKAPESSLAIAPAPPAANQTYVQVDAPIVFRGDQLPASTRRESPTYVAMLDVEQLPFPEMPVKAMTRVMGTEKKKWYQKLGEAFSGWFR